MASHGRDVLKLPHHLQEEFCTTRAKYRQGKKLTAVKLSQLQLQVYTVNNESQHLLVSGVPALGLQDELRRLFARFGDIKSLVYIPKYAEEEFTDAFHIQYTRVQSARQAKHRADGKSFYGGFLHVCYAPEMESLEETRAKLVQRRKDVAKRTKWASSEPTATTSVLPKQYHRQKKHPALPITEERLSEAKNANCIWQGIPLDIDPRVIKPAANLVQPQNVYGPLKPGDKWFQAGVKERRVIPHNTSTFKSIVPSTKTNTTSCGTSALPSSNSPILRFIPRQVNINKRIVFRNTSSSQPSSTEGGVHSKDESLKRDFTSCALENLSVEETILSVRKKIRAVSVPNIQILLERKEAL